MTLRYYTYLSKLSTVPRLQFSASSYEVLENASSITVCVNMDMVSSVDIPFVLTTSETSPPSATGNQLVMYMYMYIPFKPLELFLCSNVLQH